MAGVPRPGASRARRYNNILHRDVGYLIVGLTLVFGVSGLALNHVADWNPNYRQTRTVSQVAPLVGDDRFALVRDARAKLGLTDDPLNVFRPDPETLQLFYEGRTIAIDTPTGQVLTEETRPRPVLFAINQLHINASKGIWTFISDLYAIALIGMAITGMFVLRGPTGLGGRGKWLVGTGALIPIAYWLYRTFGG
ncbi:MAG: PepSY-associated TM helix domain-containing protein [Vicinamibacterales bacterium]